MVKNILWTGGWDSTYRILDLVLNKKETVQPYYILDYRRKSTEIEIKTMEKIKKMMEEIDSNAKARILDHVMIHIEKIPKNIDLTNNYLELKSKAHLGDQYDWLSRYAESTGMRDLELCIHLDDKAEGFVRDDVTKVEDDNDFYYRIKKESESQLKIFTYYHFPLLDMTKLEMQKKSKDSGFDNIMENTWFCHFPYKGKACGMCAPCRYTREEGLGRRVPTPSTVMKLNRKIHFKIVNLGRKLKLNN